jgi:DNA-binding NtrC family response regulator
VRQLRNCLERGVILANNGVITINELPPEVVRAPFVAPPQSVPVPAGVQPEMVVANTGPLSLREVERQQILSALEQTGWHRGKTAELLGISPSTLYRRLRDYNLEHRGSV